MNHASIPSQPAFVSYVGFSESAASFGRTSNFVGIISFTGGKSSFLPLSATVGFFSLVRSSGLKG